VAEESDKGLWVELAATVLIGLATVLGAYAAYQSALWGGNCLSSYNEGVATLNDANTEEMKGVQTYTFDMLTWMQFKIQSRAAEREADVMDGGKLEVNYPQRMATQIKKQMMDERLRHAMAWSDIVNGKLEAKVANLPVDANGEIEEKAWNAIEKDFAKLTDTAKADATSEVYKKKSAEAIANEKEDDDDEGLDFTTPQDSKEYSNSLYKKSIELKAKAKTAMEEGTKANQIGDRFTLMTVFYTIVLFFAGVCLPLRNAALQKGFLLASTVLLIMATVMMLRLPLA
jgi:hypothetical protein